MSFLLKSSLNFKSYKVLFKSLSSPNVSYQFVNNNKLYFLKGSTSRLLSTKPSLHEHLNMKIELLPALADNYMYLLIDEKTNECAVVDPVKPPDVLAAVAKHGVKLTTVLTTHHHWDHAGGNEELNSLKPGLTFYGGDHQIQPNTTIRVGHGDKLKVGSLQIECLFTPCHTTGHICYYVEDVDNDPAVFTGDTLLAAACGKFFEGTKQQMHHALVNVLQKLPASTRVYCGHEYTVSNLEFAIHVEPANQHIIDKLAQCRALRASKQATIPTTIGEEMKINPFMRVNESSVQEHVQQTDPIEVMGALREEKNNWKR
ncbi:HAGH [Bugula neritina]|uniref:hydroxyacylglutathione hydrolase n=1 Tax=Bugula neritina TaxID=10212 RepID=A0A7J7KBX3_BUGNE|nr:HAGH [Bugula neritina]